MFMGIFCRMKLSNAGRSKRLSRSLTVSMPQPMSAPTKFGTALSRIVMVVPTVQPLPM
jgi:hypothetical protein